MKQNEQKLIDLMFEMVLTTSTHKWFKNKSNDEIAKWARDKLKIFGFKTEPCGASWGVLK